MDDDVERIDLIDDFKSYHPNKHHTERTRDFLPHLPANPMILGFHPHTEKLMKACGVSREPPKEDWAKLRRRKPRWYEIIDSGRWGETLLPRFHPLLRI